MPISGAPLATKASSGPEPMPMSMALAAIACWTRGPPPKLMISRSTPCLWKMPASIPTCSGTNWNVPACGWPTRTLVCAGAGCACTGCADRVRATTSRQRFATAPSRPRGRLRPASLERRSPGSATGIAWSWLLRGRRETAMATAFVTGASYGVGAATALALARQGYAVALSATRAKNLDAVLAQLERAGARAVPVVLDLRAQESIAEAFAQVVAAFGTLDVLVNNAGANLRKRAVDVTPAEWDDVIGANVTGTFFLSQEFGRHLIAGGRPGALVNIASTHGIVGAAERSTYGISKAAIIHMTKIDRKSVV